MRAASTTSTRVRLLALACVGLLLAVLPSTTSARAEEDAPAADRRDPSAVSVTLVTGDRIVVQDETGGRRSITVEPGE